MVVKSGFAPIQTSGCLVRDDKPGRPGNRTYQRGRDEYRDYPQYVTSAGNDNGRGLQYGDNVDSGSCFETICSSIGPNGWDEDPGDEYANEQSEAMRNAGWFEKKASGFDSYRGHFQSRMGGSKPPIQLKIAHLEPISIRPKNKTPQIVNVCQTFRFPDNFITQNNANRLGQHQEQHFHDATSGSENRQQPQQPHVGYGINRCKSGLGGFFGVNRPRQRSMHSQTSRTLLELVAAGQSAQQQPDQSRPTALPRTVYGGTLPPRMAQDTQLTTTSSESTISDPRINRRAKANGQRVAANVHSPPVVSFFRRKKMADGGASAKVTNYGRTGNHSRMAGVGRQPRQAGVVRGKPVDHRKLLYEDLQECPFVSDPLVSITRRNRRQTLGPGKLSLDEDNFEEDSDRSDEDELDYQDLDSDGCMNLNESHQHDDLDEESEEEPLGEPSPQIQRRDNRAGGRVAGLKEGSAGISGIVDKLQDNVWEVCLEGIWDLMDMASLIDWKAQEKYITIINRKLIEFLKSPRTALCRSACHVSGELFREAKSTRHPEFDEIVDILLCKTADPNRFIQKDANVALDKLVANIQTPHIVRVLSNRGTIHRNPLVRKATARLLVCICGVAGLDTILGKNANTRTRKTILSMLAKILTDKNLETRKFGEQLYCMLRKHKFFDEYFYKDMDNNLRTNLKRILKGL